MSCVESPDNLVRHIYCSWYYAKLWIQGVAVSEVFPLQFWPLFLVRNKSKILFLQSLLGDAVTASLHEFHDDISIDNGEVGHRLEFEILNIPSSEGVERLGDSKRRVIIL